MKDSLSVLWFEFAKIGGPQASHDLPAAHFLLMKRKRWYFYCVARPLLLGSLMVLAATLR